MGRNDVRAEFEALDLDNRLRDARLESTKVKEITSLDPADMTVGELITLANAVEAIRALTDFAEGARVSQGPSGLLPEYTPAYGAEKRGAAPGYFEATNAGDERYRDVYAEDQAVTAEERDKREAAAQRLISLLSGTIPDEYEVPTVNGPVRYSDVPKTPDGRPEPAWIDANCTCDDHERKRIEADQPKIGSADLDGKPIPSGMYL